jgi:transcription antitermination factor NusG
MTWFIAITNPNCHRRAESGLAAIGYSAFWPRYRKWASHARVKIAKEYPVLGRYLFVEIPNENFWAVRAVEGIEGLLTGDKGAPAEVREETVWDIRERYLAGEWDFVRRRRPVFGWDSQSRRNIIVDWEDNGPLPTGARVEIMEGEFEGLLTVIRSRNSRGKLEFLPPGKREIVSTRESNVRAA